jgi:hypothetical protein
MATLTLPKGQAVITWAAATGTTYRLQYRDDLAAGKWTNLLPEVIAISPTATVTNSMGDGPQRFFRVNIVTIVVSFNACGTASLQMPPESSGIETQIPIRATCAAPRAGF